MFASLTVFTACGSPDNGDGGDSLHTCSFTECVAESRYLATIATCTAPATYYKSCTCSLSGTETFSEGEPLGHNWSKKDSLFDGTKRHSSFCYNCSERIIEDCVGSEADCITSSYCIECSCYVSGPDYTNHFVSSDPSYSGISKACGDGTKHEITCNFCNHLIEYENCYGGKATCSSQATCEGCNNSYGTIDESAHLLNDQWLGKIDGSHAKSCYLCHQDIIVENCDFSNATCSERGHCSKCNSDGDFNYDNHLGETEWVIGTYTHYTAWNCCGNPDFIGENNVPLLHDWENGRCTTCNYDCLHSGGTATCSTLATCEICNAGYGDYNPNNHSSTGYWIQNKQTHAHYYNCCSSYDVQSVEHNWSNGYCYTCSFECVHEGGVATCTLGAHCDYCDMNYGEIDPNNHNLYESYSCGYDGEYYHYNTCTNGCFNVLNKEYCSGGVANCTSPAICSTCSNFYGSVALGVHNISTYYVSSGDGHTHYQVCTYGCDSLFNGGLCSGGVANCTTPAICVDCGGEHGEIDPDNHDISQAYTNNGDDTHYNACLYGCDTKFNVTNCFGGEATCSTLATCENCNTHYGELDADNHSKADTFVSDGDNTHYKTCLYGCGTKLDQSDCFGGIATCSTLAKCDDCSSYYGELDANNHPLDPSYSFTDNYTHTTSYICCSTQQTVSHDWLNGLCETCNHTCSHKGGVATCSTLAKCDYCDSRYGELDDSSHDMVGNECTGCHLLTVSQGLMFTKYSPSSGDYWVLTGRGTNTDKHLVLPETTYDGHPYQFPLNGISGDELLESVTAHGIAQVDFRNCPNLKKVDLTAVGSIAISNCHNLEDVIIGGTVSYLNINSAYNLKEVNFKENTTVNEIRIPNSPNLISLDLSKLEVKTIGNSAFANNAKMREINLGDTVETIGYSAFKNCMSLTKIVIPESVTSIVLGSSLTEPNAFTGCYKLVEIENHSSVQITTDGIHSRVCIYKPNASEEDIANGVKTESDIVIEDGFAYNKNNPTKLLAYVDYDKTGSVTIPDKFTYIESYVFAYCYNLTEVISPSYEQIGVNLDNVTLGNSVFQGCTSLESINIPYIDPPSDRWGRSNSFLWLFGSCPYNADEWNTNNDWKMLYFDCVSITGDEGRVYKLPPTLKKLTIQGGTYRTYCALQNVYFLEEITFVNFTSVSAEIIPTSVKTINFPTNGKLTNINGTFAYHNNITHLIIPEGVLWVPELGSMQSLMHITIPSTAKASNKDVFKKLPSLVQVKNNSNYIDDSYFPEGVNVYSDSEGENKIVKEGDFIYLIDGDKKIIISYQGNATELVLDEAVSLISGGAFKNSSVEKITLGSSVEKIGANAFDNSALKEINIPASLTYVDNYAFNNTKIAVADLSNVTYIGDYAFANTLLENVTLSDNLTYLGKYAFACTKISSVSIPNSITSISDYAFNSCELLESVQLHENLLTIGQGAFASCTSLTSFTVPSSVVELGRNCIDGCSSLTYLSIDFVGRYADGSLNTTDDYRRITYISTTLSTVKTIRINMTYIPELYMLFNHFGNLEKVIIGPRLVSIPSESTPYDVQYEFEEPANWEVKDRYGYYLTTITKEQCNDGYTLHDILHADYTRSLRKIAE